MNNWLIFIFGLVVGLYIKAYIHDLSIRAILKHLFKDDKVSDAIKDGLNITKKSKFAQRLEDLKKAQETKQPKQ